MLATSRLLQRFLHSTLAVRTLVLLASTMLLAWLTEATAAPKAYVGLLKDDAIAVLDTDTNRLQGTIPVPQGPHGMVMTPDGRKVYVSSDGASTVSVIDTVTDKVAASIEVGQTPHGLAITPDGSRVLVAVFGTDEVSAIDTTTNQLSWKVAVA